MVHRKGELTSAGIARDWPYQVALPEPSVVGKNITIIERFCHGLNLCSRRQHFRRDGVEYIVFCFKEQLDADYFRTYFLGEPPRDASAKISEAAKALGRQRWFHDVAGAGADSIHASACIGPRVCTRNDIHAVRVPAHWLLPTLTLT